MMSRKKRIFIIIQLIFAFTFLSWLLMKPFVMEVISRKSQISLYEMVMEREALFQALSPEEQAEVKLGYDAVKHSSGTPLLRQVGSLLFVDTSPFVLAWIFFSILICMLLLFHIEGAGAAAWILPALVIGYAYFFYTAPSPKPEGLFPSESYVRENYVQTEEGLSRHETLLKAWHHYLVKEWTNEEPNPDQFEAQVDKGLFAFNIARLKWIRDGKGDEVVLAGFASHPSFLRVFSYFLWNLIFAWLINRRAKVSHSAPLSSPN